MAILKDANAKFAALGLTEPYLYTEAPTRTTLRVVFADGGACATYAEAVQYVHEQCDSALIGYTQIAVLAGVSAATLQRYKFTSNMPAPDELPAPDRPRWRVATITEWLNNRPGIGRPLAGHRQHKPKVDTS